MSTPAERLTAWNNGDLDVPDNYDPDSFDWERDLRAVLEQRAALLEAHELDLDPPGPDFLDWVADRLVFVYKESPDVDFVLALRRKAQKARAAIAKATAL